MRPTAVLLEAGMTSDVGVEHIAEQPFLFHCSCGAAIETSEKMVTCGDCGETVEVRRCVATPYGKKYTLRISKHRRDSNTEPLLAGCGTAATHSTWPHHGAPDYDRLFRSVSATHRRHHQTPDYNERFTFLGLLILLAPLWIPTLLIFFSFVFEPPAVEQGRSDPRVIETPRPTDCGLFSGCHYEKRVIHFTDKQGAHVVVEWQRVGD
jgi:predicted RNA-binding Zn-ribbon protein involved in translation (DUF1610 family)